jgi:histidinol dehydrogenase
MKDLLVVDIDSLSAEERAEIMKRRPAPTLSEEVARIIKEVKQDGDQALLRFMKEFDGADVSLRVAEKDIEKAGDLLDPNVKKALQNLVKRIRVHHEGQEALGSWQKESGGIVTGERTLPLDSVALYVPGGKGRFPSVMAMLAVPARMAGVSRIVVVSPPSSDGVDPATLYLANELSINEVYAVGGAGAVAALALGTTSLPRVDKIIGPGSGYMNEAKRQLAYLIDPGALAGPSEAIVLADESSDPMTVAKELLVEAEHGPDSRVLLLTTSSSLARDVSRTVPFLIEQLPERRREFARSVFQQKSIFYHEDMEQIIEFSNSFAPEHLRLLTKDDQAVYEKIRNAGEVLLGAYSSIALGNYAVGVNAILPTASFARSTSCLGVLDFCKRNSYVKLDREAARSLVEDAVVLADYEGFPAHKKAAQDLLPE